MDYHTPILITGATGFVGSYTARLLIQQGYTQLHALRRPGSQLTLLGAAADKITWHEAELEDYFSLEAALEGIDTIIHCAALVSFAPRDKEKLLTINRKGTQYLVDAALFQKVRRLIHVSSVAALGRNNHGHLISESSKWEDGRLVTNYSRSKFLAELEVWRGQEEGMSVAAVYPSIILGAGHWSEGTAKMFAYAQQSPTYYPTGSTGVVDVRDVAEAILLTLKRDEKNDRFLLNGANLSYRELLTQMTTALGVPAPKKPLPKWGAQLLAIAEKIRTIFTRSTPLLTSETVRASYQNYVYDSRHSEETLGMTYRDAETTIGETAALFMATREEGSGVLGL
ncbi:NAD-dependent epimerase/dehydratase family protein [Lewinella cohaerens]|uniref:NAD-dependent epimerase/dehydratase family protein n=1 Tax=Lewinella cohaerens TaxID=70995 RepID=UPI0003807603|nr:NAD-dependent epimerase/dehydratase family protein [Lewinella cohaerens]